MLCACGQRGVRRQIRGKPETEEQQAGGGRNRRARDLGEIEIDVPMGQCMAVRVKNVEPRGAAGIASLVVRAEAHLEHSVASERTGRVDAAPSRGLRAKPPQRIRCLKAAQPRVTALPECQELQNAQHMSTITHLNNNVAQPI